MLKYMVGYTAPLLVSAGLIYAGNNLVDVANIKHGLLKAGFSDSLATIKYGQFGNYVQILSVPSIVISALSISVLPIIAKANAIGDMKKLGENIKLIFKLCFLISIPSAVGLFVLSKPVFILIFGHSNSQASELMTVGSSIIIFSSMFQITNTIMNSLGKVYRGTLAALTGVILKIMLNFLLIPLSFINIYGAIVGLLFTNLVPMMMNSISIKQYINSDENYLNQWAKPTISSVIMGVVVFASYACVHTALNFFLMPYISNALALVTSVYIGAITYFKALVMTKGVTADEISFIPSRIKRALLIH